MPRLPLTLDALAGWIRGLPGASAGAPSVEPSVVMVDIDVSLLGPVPELHSGIPAVVVGVTASDRPDAHAAHAACDLVLARGDAALDAIVATVEANPIASTALAMLLRSAPHRTLDDGLSAESAVYSALQGGPEFARWRASRPARERPANGEAVRLERVGPVLDITLDRPEVRNAFSTAMRDALVEAFRLPTLDPTITEVHLRGAGDAFCAGGDLDEFGSFTDPASAHVVRLQQSVGRSIATVADRVTVHLHGACMGSGIELPAFADRVLAHPSTVIALPEVSLGLIPGAGGTVSLPRRIGRWRTARLALTGEHIDAQTALRWGLVDAIDDR
ncbi:MAG: enoyl-CoA hydratase/isomerase family protein [Microthrixaceae bacterium]